MSGEGAHVIPLYTVNAHAASSRPLPKHPVGASPGSGPGHDSSHPHAFTPSSNLPNGPPSRCISWE